MLLQRISRLSLAIAAILLVVPGVYAETEPAAASAGIAPYPAARFNAEELCARIVKKLRSVQSQDCQRSTLTATQGVSVEGNPIVMREYPPLAARQPLGRVLLLGGIHGDEFSSVSIVFHWMRALNDHHSGMFHWHVVPLLNPDGLLRKTSQRMNSNGVDLNRNFPTPDWRADSAEYVVAKNERNPRRYPGPNPLSEPETRWLTEQIGEFKPDVIVSVHAPYGILDFDGPKEAPRKLGALRLSLLGTYPGSLGNFAGIQNEIPVVTIELPYAGIMPTDTQVSAIWTDLVQWLVKNLTPPASASQTDAMVQVGGPS